LFGRAEVIAQVADRFGVWSRSATATDVGPLTTRPGSSFSSREGPVCDQDELFLE